MDCRPPDDFRCPISLELMSDPVILCTGQTYDRSSIQRWLASGKRICPNTTMPLDDTKLIPNYALRSLISQWAQTHGVDLKRPAASVSPPGGRPNAHGHETLKTLEALVKTLANNRNQNRQNSSCISFVRDAVREIRTLAKQNRETRLRLVEAGVVAKMLPLLSCGDRQTEENAMVALFRLSLEDDNKVGLVAEGAVDAIVNALKHGSLETRTTAAVTLTSLAMVDVNKATIGSHSDAIGALVKLLAEGDFRSRKEATTALYSLCFYNDNKRRAVMSGAVPLLLDSVTGVVLNETAERPLGLLNMLATVSEGRYAIALQKGVMGTLTRVLSEGTFRSKEHAVSILSSLCCNSKQRAVEGRQAGVMEHCKKFVEDGTARTKPKASALMKALEESASNGMGN
uniref:RING-type E3 ubiquitin transferase n=1 Tax=Araucaria cunninghamii TaxID=56994 RepID=A0A0D6QVI2_ARACU